MSHLTLSIGQETLADRLLGRGLTVDAVAIVTGVAIISIAAQLSIPVWSMPISVQVLAVILVGMSLGAPRAVITTFLYAVLGALGLAIFPGSASGTGAIADLSSGYLVGLIGAAAFVGWVAQRGLDRTLLLSLVSATGGAAILCLAGLFRGLLTLGDPLDGFPALVLSAVASVLVAAAINAASWSSVLRAERRDRQPPGGAS